MVGEFQFILDSAGSHRVVVVLGDLVYLGARGVGRRHAFDRAIKARCDVGRTALNLTPEFVVIVLDDVPRLVLYVHGLAKGVVGVAHDVAGTRRDSRLGVGAGVGRIRILHRSAQVTARDLHLARSRGGGSVDVVRCLVAPYGLACRQLDPQTIGIRVRNRLGG